MSEHASHFPSRPVTGRIVNCRTRRLEELIQRQLNSGAPPPAGTIMGCVANCLSIIFLGLLREEPVGGVAGGRGAGTGMGAGKRVGADHAVRSCY